MVKEIKSSIYQAEEAIRRYRLIEDLLNTFNASVTTINTGTELNINIQFYIGTDTINNIIKELLRHYVEVANAR